jgi:hypothetical protein
VLDFWSHVARGQQEGRTIERSILLNEEIGKTAGIKDSVENSPQIIKREDISDDRMMQKSGVKFTAQQDMIWKSVKRFWIAKGCHHRHHKKQGTPDRWSLTQQKLDFLHA